MSQRRAYQRFPVDLPVLFSWKAEGKRETGRGMVRDINVQGLYVVAAGGPPEGAIVRCVVLLPALEENAPASVFTAANIVGRVLRREWGGSRAGFAVRNRAFVLTRETFNYGYSA